MYEDDDLWPLMCPGCRHGFMEKIGRIKSGLVLNCAECCSNIAVITEDFSALVSEAREGRYNPWWDILSEEPRD